MADDAAGAVRRTPRPTPYPRPSGDHQAPETTASAAPGATNTATPVSQDAGSATGELSPGFAAAVVERTERALATLSADVDRVVAEFAALPECTACGGSGKDDHATPFEAPLAVHFAGPPVKAEGRRRQLCMWCGHVLIDVALTRDTEPPEWPVSALIKVEDGVATIAPHKPGAELPPGCCALPDDEPAAWEPAIGEKVTGVETETIGQPTVVGWFESSGYDGLSWLKIQPDDPTTAQKYLVATSSLKPCPEVENGPNEAQETRAAADWPAEPADQRWDEREPLDIDPGDAVDGGNSDEDGDDGA